MGSAEWVGGKRRAWEGKRCRKWGAGSGVASRTGFGFWRGSKGSENAGGSLSRLVLSEGEMRDLP